MRPLGILKMDLMSEHEGEDIEADNVATDGAINRDTEKSKEDDIWDRARRYLAKKKEDAMSCLKVVFVDKINTYEAIKKHNMPAMAVCKSGHTDQTHHI